MTGRGTITGWKLPNEERERLLARFPPKYARTVADHVTLDAKAGKDAPLPKPESARVVGRADDDDSLECLVVEIDGTTDRPDGSTYHITWSLGPDRRAVESNDVLRDEGWSELGDAIPIAITPARF